MLKENTLTKSYAIYLRFPTRVFPETIAVIEQDLRQHHRIRHLRPVASFVEVIDLHRLSYSPKLREIIRSNDRLDYLFIPFWGMLGSDIDEIIYLIELFRRHQIELNSPKFWLHYENRGWKVELNRLLRSR